MKPGPDLVIFDCDGVLVDSERLTTKVEARVLTELGWPMEQAEVVRRWMGRTSQAQLAEVSARLGSEAAARFDARTTDELHAAFETELEAIAGIPALLDHLDAHGIATCVASSGTHHRMSVTLRVTGLRERFEGRIYSGTEVVHGKPAPDLFLHAAAGMGVDPHRCVVVEDSVFGVQAGVAAGMRVYGFAGGLTPAAALADAGAEVVHEMSDLVGLLPHSPSRIA
ncbi:HAD family hydrolase [Nocardioides sp.]|uniref:HAD family hydrolase n=1 Tax=Nocardioides sp. TaxID=35761 RepID=UPI0039C9398B